MTHKVKKKMEDLDAPLVTVRGLVIPVSWDGEGNPCSTSIQSPGEIEYIVQQDQEGNKLLQLAGQEVEITGFLTKSMKDKKQISVTRCKLLKNRD
jgi:hypothetical protein